ncbi:hypothetical protein [Streptomyces sp. NPDC059491]|uniref:hypothetical protein n=1 Tax=Streptomyces sp. NPDC059491 TaxID=3346850 RepID=UPI0036B95C1D
MGEPTVVKAYQLLRAILNTAVDDELIRRNPCRNKGADRYNVPERPHLTVVEVYAVADKAPKSAAGIRLVAFPAEIAPEPAHPLEHFAGAGQDGHLFRGARGGLFRRTNLRDDRTAARPLSGSNRRSPLQKFGLASPREGNLLLAVAVDSRAGLPSSTVVDVSQGCRRLLYSARLDDRVFTAGSRRQASALLLREDPSSPGGYLSQRFTRARLDDLRRLRVDGHGEERLAGLLFIRGVQIHGGIVTCPDVGAAIEQHRKQSLHLLCIHAVILHDGPEGLTGDLKLCGGTAITATSTVGPRRAQAGRRLFTRAGGRNHV